MSKYDGFFKLIDIYNTAPTPKEIQPFDMPTLLGELLINRMGGVAYEALNQNGTFKGYPKEFKTALENAHLANSIKTEIFKKHLKYLSGVFANTSFKYAFLKGAFLSTKVYKDGLRTSNDIDVLLLQQDITACQQLLLQNGFVQGKYDKQSGIIPATRQEIIHSRMNFGETIPFVKIIDNNCLEVDLNFSLDFKAKNNNDTISLMLSDAQRVEVDGEYEFYTLSLPHFLIHLCCHLYKEATTYDWVASNRDLTLYKFCDIYMFLKQYGNAEYFDVLEQEICKLNLYKECCYTFRNTSLIYPRMFEISGFKDFLARIEPQDKAFLKQIYWPKRKQIFEYDMDFEDWIFCRNKRAQLRLIGQ